jgi:phosphoribosylamine--glycine ligase
MIDGGVPKVLEFNARLGDPETQPLMLRMKSDIVPYLVQIAEGSLKSGPLEWDERPAVCVVIAARGYPGDYSKGIEIGGLEEAAKVKDAFVFHAGTSLKDGKVTSSGGRVLGVTAMGDGYRGAISRAYEAASRIRFEGGHYRCDIGRRALDR